VLVRFSAATRTGIALVMLVVAVAAVVVRMLLIYELGRAEGESTLPQSHSFFK